VRLLLVIDSLDVGGAERYVVDLARTLHARCDVTVACSTAGPLATELDAAGVAVRPLTRRLVKRRFSPLYAWALRRLVARGHFDVVHAHLYASEAAAAIATMGRRVPLVVTDHTEGPWRGRGAEAVSRWTYARARRVMTVSEAIRERLIRDFGVPAQRITYVPNAVVPLRPGRGMDGPRGPQRRLRVGRVARLEPEKGVDVFLQAVARLAPRFRDVDFVVIGDGPLHGRLVALAERLDVADRVRFLGLRPDARALIERLDVLAVSSITDGSPLVVLEAMGVGVPVVGTAVGGIPDQVRDGRDGLLVAPRDADGLAAALASVLADGALRRRLGESARRRAAQQFSYEAFLARVEGVYASVAAMPAPRAASHGAHIPAGARPS
jgi:glycosyltransferase involved in cell wall biosynthesis